MRWIWIGNGNEMDLGRKGVWALRLCRFVSPGCNEIWILGGGSKVS